MLSIKHLNPSTSIICSSRTLQLFKKQIYFQSTAVATNNKNEKKDIHSEYPLLDTKFNQHKIAYQYRRNAELLRGYLVYRLFSVNFLVNNQAKIAEWSQRILGTRLFNSALKRTTFGHFAGGENPEELIPVIKRLLTYDVKPLLDYSVESDDTSITSPSSDYVDGMHDYNTDKFVECIKISHDICGPNNFAVIKVTALVRPGVLKKFNTLLQSIENRSSLPSLFELLNLEQKNEKTIKLFQKSTESNLPNNQNDLSTNAILTQEELAEIHKLLTRLNRIAQACVEYRTSIMVDAEQTYYQTAINYLATELQRYYNKNKNAYFYGTYQCYLKNTPNSLKHDIALAEKNNYTFAAKLVRGAYIEQERQLAREQGYEDPIHPNVEATSKTYHACLDEVLKTMLKRELGDVRLMVASHNEDTVRYAVQRMKDNNIGRDSGLVAFASLYGMSDYITFALANSGYKTYKYLPYGPIEALQPYLFRRAQENRAIFAKAEKDRRLHLKALKERVLRSNV